MPPSVSPGSDDESDSRDVVFFNVGYSYTLLEDTTKLSKFEFYCPRGLLVAIFVRLLRRSSSPLSLSVWSRVCRILNFVGCR